MPDDTNHMPNLATANGQPTDARRTARHTGYAYLGLAISGMLGFLVVRGQLYVPGDATQTALNLATHPGRARFGVVADITTVLTQTVTAVWFWKLFRPVNAVAAGSLAAFGLVNAVVILIATAFSATALHEATQSAQDTQLLYDLNAGLYSLAGLFFGLWLIPMGRLAAQSRYMPRPLGWLLVAGGIGYILSTFTAALPAAPGTAYALTVPATIGELWMVGYLLTKGTSRHPPIGDLLTKSASQQPPAASH